MGRPSASGRAVRCAAAIGRCAAGLAALAGVAALPTPSIAQTPSFTLVGVVPGGQASFVNGVSADGNAAAGGSDGFGSPGFRWTRQGSRNDFGTAFPTVDTFGMGISGDGAVVVGGGGVANSHAFRWSESGGYQDLGVLGGFTRSTALDASYNGSTVVGYLSDPFSARAFRWTEAGGMQVLDANRTARAFATNGDGSVVVGGAVGPDRAFVWTPTSGMQVLPALDGSLSGSAQAVNFDGSIVVGYSSPVGGGSNVGTMWVNGVPQQLLTSSPDIIGFSPWGVSDDGSVVAGAINIGGFLWAGVWTPATGTMPLAEYLTLNGVNVPLGERLLDCAGVSADGKVFVGESLGLVRSEGYVATVPSPGASGVVLIAGIIASAQRRRARRS